MPNDKEAADALLQKSIDLANAGDKVTARRTVRRAALLDPTNETIWFCRASLAQTASEATQALDRVQALNPTHPYLEKARAWVKRTWPTPADLSPDLPPQRWRRPWLVKLATGVASAGLVIVLGLIIIGLDIPEATATNLMSSIVPTPTQTTAQMLAELDQAAAQARVANDLSATIDHLVAMRALAPNDEQLATRLAERYYEQGLAWRDANRLQSAQQSFGWALEVNPDFAAAKQEREVLDLYLTGVDAFQAAEWAEAASIFEAVYQQDRTYLSVDEILYSAYYNLGLRQEASGQLEPALETYQKAMSILPDALEAELKARRVTRKLNPPAVPTPTAKPAIEKHIIVDISDQRTYLYEDDELVYDFISSTGEPGRDTALGKFEIQSKIPWPMPAPGIWICPFGWVFTTPDRWKMASTPCRPCATRG